MSDMYSLIKTVHILSSTILFGTGIGTAFQMWFAHRSNHPQVIAAVARHVVLADFCFTLPAVILQPVSGIALIQLAGINPFASWLVAVYGLYAFTGLCWLPVIWLQIKLRDMALSAVETGLPLGAVYHRYFRIWFILGWPAFIAVIAIFWLMTAKPNLW